MTLLTISEYAAHLRAVASVHAAESRVELATRLLTQANALKDDGIASKIDVESSLMKRSATLAPLLAAYPAGFRSLSINPSLTPEPPKSIQYP